jgi:hypothetical protein
LKNSNVKKIFGKKNLKKTFLTFEKFKRQKSFTFEKFKRQKNFWKKKFKKNFSDV